ncbi:hypothetical protein [Shimazuella alba]|uniref:Uncharacterized protein n=1 Tax=Shimazuella alba TaxID=2690964 RepID=A0A6I4VQQ0_9BACL|nr:hypothetical protein [Shimazuella alba]MXQ53413.1 hypothetical protein [Shimazuella alba]
MKKKHIGFATFGSLLTILFLYVVNQITNPEYPWFIFPTFALLLWPITLLLVTRGKHKLYAVICSLMIIALFILNNFYFSDTSHPWFLYPSYLLLWWPITLFVGKRAKTLTFAIIASTSTILYYSLLNISLSPEYPWAIYPAYLVLWWPISLYFARQKNHFGLSLAGSLLTTLFFIVVNVVSTPDQIWAVYPIFLILWWPLSMYYYEERKRA